MNNKTIKSVLVLSILVSVSLANAVSKKPAPAKECPEKLRVEVSDLAITDQNNTDAINKIYKLGEEQTPVDYIATVLASAGAYTSFADDLKLTKLDKNSYPKICRYKGQTLTMGLQLAGFKQKPVALLDFAAIEYKNPDPHGTLISNNGYGAYIKTTLRSVDSLKLVPYMRRRSHAYIDLNVQVPMGDYGTEGFTENADIGYSSNVVYTIEK